MLTRLGELISHISQKWGCEVVEFNGESDHVHLLFRYYPQMQLSKFVNALKSYTSQQIRKEFLMEIRRKVCHGEYPRWRALRVYWGKPVFWNSAYFVATREWGDCRSSKTIRAKPGLGDLRPRQNGDSSPTPLTPSS